MKTLAEQIEVMKAALEGKPILAKHRGADSSQFEVRETPVFDWHWYDYDVYTEKPSIDWSHVSPEYRWLFVTSHGEGVLAEEKPDLYSQADIDTPGYWLVNPGNKFIEVEGFASYKRGDCPWYDSLVERS